MDTIWLQPQHINTDIECCLNALNKIGKHCVQGQSLQGEGPILVYRIYTKYFWIIFLVCVIVF